MICQAAARFHCADYESTPVYDLSGTCGNLERKVHHLMTKEMREGILAQLSQFKLKDPEREKL